MIALPHRASRKSFESADSRMFAEALKSIGLGLGAWHLWSRLGWYDLLARYRRSVIGPMWLILTLAVYTATLSIVYSTLFKANVGDFVPLVAAGMLVWNFVSGVLSEASITFIESEVYIKQVRQPLFMYVCRVLWRHVIIFGHNLLVVLAAVLLTKGWPGAPVLLVVPGILLLGINTLWMLLILAVFGARFRDIQQMVNTLMQVIFFVTPIFWPVALLGPRMWIAEVNPLYHLIELVRAPLLGEAPSVESLSIGVGLAIFGWVAALYLFGRFRDRIVYWL